MKRTAGIFQNRAQIDIANINHDTREFDVIFATETPVFRRGWDEDYYEVLRCIKAAIRGDRLDSGNVALVDTHSSHSIRNQMGRVVSWAIEKGHCRARIQFSRQDTFSGIRQDITAGVIRGISVGYRVWKYEREAPESGAVATYRAVDWEPVEISLAVIPADPFSSVRADAGDSNEVTIINHMEGQQQNEPQQGGGQTPAPTPAATPVRAEGQNNEQRTDPPPPPPGNPPTPAVDPAAAPNATQSAVAGERQRVLQIQHAVRAAGLDSDFADQLIEAGRDIDASRAAIIDRMAQLSTTNGIRTIHTGGNGTSETELLRTAMTDALMNRAAPGSVKLEGKAQDFQYMSLVELAKRCLEQRGDNPNQYSKNELIHRAIATTDYPNLLSNVTERFIRRYYEAVVPEWKRFARQVPAADFREKTGIKVDASVTFEELAEGGEYKETKIVNDESAKIKLRTYARKFSITRQAIINDDLSVFTRLPQWLALGAQQFQSRKIWGLITGNAKAPDGAALFHTAHKNLAAAGAAIADGSLSDGRTAMRRQRSPQGNELGISPRFLIVPPELETISQKILTGITAHTTGEVNIWNSRLEPVVIDYLTNTQEWYLAADPNAIMSDGLVYAYLEGQEGLYTQSETDFNTDNVVTKARLDFDAAVWGWQGWYKNPGA